MGLFGNLIGQRFEELACKPAPRSQWQEWLADVLLNAACACSSDRRCLANEIALTPCAKFVATTFGTECFSAANGLGRSTKERAATWRRACAAAGALRRRKQAGKP